MNAEGEKVFEDENLPIISRISDTAYSVKGYSLQEVYQMIGGIRIFHYFASLMLIMGYMSG